MASRISKTRQRRNTKLVVYGAIVLLVVAAHQTGTFTYWGLALAVWGAFELLFVPTQCRATTRRGGTCRNTCHGLLFGCHIPGHGSGKRRDLWRTLRGQSVSPGNAPRLRSPGRGPAPAGPDPDRVTAEPGQRHMFALSVAGVVIGVVQTVLAVIPMV